MNNDNEKLIQSHAAKVFHVNEDEILIKKRFLGGLSHLLI